MIKRPIAPTIMWGELELRAYGAVRLFLQSITEQPYDKPRLVRLAQEAHDALYRVERAHRLPEIDPGSMEHP